MKPWLGRKVKELLGGEEPSLVDFVAGLLRKRAAPPALLAEMEDLLQADAPGFVLKLYSVIIYELEKAAAGLA